MKIYDNAPIVLDMPLPKRRTAPRHDANHASSKKAVNSRLLLAGGALGLTAAAFVLVAPELGLASAVGAVVAGAGSAGMTFLARR